MRNYQLTSIYHKYSSRGRRKSKGHAETQLTFRNELPLLRPLQCHRSSRLLRLPHPLALEDVGERAEHFAGFVVAGQALLAGVDRAQHAHLGAVAIDLQIVAGLSASRACFSKASSSRVGMSLTPFIPSTLSAS